MTNQEKYDLLAGNEVGIPSCMAVIARDKNFEFTEKQIEEALKSNKEFKLVSFSAIEEPDPLVADYDTKIEYKGEAYHVRLYVDEVKNLSLSEYGFANSIDEESLQIATSQPFFLGVELDFGDNPLESFHLQLKIMNAVVPNASLCVDFTSLRLLAAQWLAMTAGSATPPSPNYLYTIHGVYDQKSDDETFYWFHTHGLHRCKSVELEMVNIKQYPEQMHTLLNMIVTRFLNDAAKEKETFMVGYDGMGIDMCWLRWEEALKDFPADILGGLNERQEENNVHAEPVGVIYAVQDGNMISPEIYGKTLADNPIYYISNEETQRMSDLAKERFHFYKEVFDKEAPKPEKKSLFGKLFKKEEEKTNWGFIVKLGLDVDSADDMASNKEHLWYDVIAIDENNNITGKLLNQPYWISNLNEGDVATYPLDLLTDWMIYGPEKTYTSDTIYELGFK